MIYSSVSFLVKHSLKKKDYSIFVLRYSVYNELIYIYYVHCFSLHKLGQIESRQSIMKIVLILSHFVTKTFMIMKAIAMKHVTISQI